MDLKETLQTYIEAAHTHAAETVRGEDAKKINRAYDRIEESVRVLMQSAEGKAALKQLLQSPDGYVRTWTAMALAAEEPRACKKILKETAQEKGIWAGTVRTFLEEWKKGNLNSAFSQHHS